MMPVMRAQSYNQQGLPPIAARRQRSKMDPHIIKEIGMTANNAGTNVDNSAESSADKGQDGTIGRKWDQVTGGTTSAATMGAGATGEIAATADSKPAAQKADASAMGQAGRTDDLLAGGSGEEQGDQGFQGKAGAHGQGSQAAAGTVTRQADADETRSNDK
jgi:hypothetical protein